MRWAVVWTQQISVESETGWRASVLGLGTRIHVFGALRLELVSAIRVPFREF